MNIYELADHLESCPPRCNPFQSHLFFNTHETEELRTASKPWNKKKFKVKNQDIHQILEAASNTSCYNLFKDNSHLFFRERN